MADESEQTLQKPATTPKIPKNRSRRFLKFFVAILLCVTSSAATTWGLLTSGLVKPDVAQTITQNRDKIVLQEGEIVADVFKKVSPATVAITTEAQTKTQRFQPSVQEGAGSGILISKDGYVLTNKHVVPEGTTKVTVVLADGRELTDVKVVGRDPSNDIAFLKIANEDNLPYAEIGDSSKVEPGQKVVAIGNALGEFRNSVTTGIISGIGRPIEAAGEDLTGGSEKLENLFQTDAAINPGNSGGPLVNLQGQVIGVNTAIAEQAEGIGFAIPINDAKSLIDSVLRQGKIIKPYLGVRYVSLTPEIAEQLRLSTTKGAYIHGDGRSSAVIPDSPAAKAGLQEGEIIVKINGSEVNESNSLGNLLAQQSVGNKVTMTILRDNKERTIEVTLEAYPDL